MRSQFTTAQEARELAGPAITQLCILQHIIQHQPSTHGGVLTCSNSDVSCSCCGVLALCQTRHHHPQTTQQPAGAAVSAVLQPGMATSVSCVHAGQSGCQTGPCHASLQLQVLDCSAEGTGIIDWCSIPGSTVTLGDAQYTPWWPEADSETTLNLTCRLCIVMHGNGEW